MATINARMQQRKDTAALWSSHNPILRSGELGLETDTGELKVGDGVTRWNDLDYALGGLTEAVAAAQVAQGLAEDAQAAAEAVGATHDAQTAANIDTGEATQAAGDARWVQVGEVVRYSPDYGDWLLADKQPIIAAAFAAGPGDVLVPGPAAIESTIVVPQGRALVGHGSTLGGTTADPNITYITSAPGVTAVKLERGAGAGRQAVRGMLIRSLDNGSGGAADGILVHSARATLEDVTVIEFAGHGIHVESNPVASGINSNLLFGRGVASRSNGGDGLHFVGSDSNRSTFYGLDVSSNAGYGIYNDSSRGKFSGMHANYNTLGCVYDIGLGNDYDIYAENNGGGIDNQKFILGTGSAYGRVYSNGYAPITLELDTGASVAILDTWDVYQDSGKRGHLRLFPHNLDGTGKTRIFRNGRSSANQMQVYNETDAAVEWEWDATYLRPGADNARDLGASTRQWRDVYAGSALVLGDTGALPAATSGRRGRVVVVRGGVGVADQLYICRKNAADAYEWVTLT